MLDLDAIDAHAPGTGYTVYCPTWIPRNTAWDDNLDVFADHAHAFEKDVFDASGLILMSGKPAPKILVDDSGDVWIRGTRHSVGGYEVDGLYAMNCDVVLYRMWHRAGARGFVEHCRATKANAWDMLYAATARLAMLHDGCPYGDGPWFEDALHATEEQLEYTCRVARRWLRMRDGFRL